MNNAPSDRFLKFIDFTFLSTADIEPDLLIILTFHLFIDCVRENESKSDSMYVEEEQSDMGNVYTFGVGVCCHNV